ncbi:MAG: hypothetical protein AAGF12_14990 [Myxococcota bacterium]
MRVVAPHAVAWLVLALNLSGCVQELGLLGVQERDGGQADASNDGSSDAVGQPDRADAGVFVPPRDRSVAAGYDHSCAIGRGGRLLCWGNNEEGQVGDGTFGEDRPAPTSVVRPVSGWVAVSTEEFTTCGIQGNGDLYCWGSGQRGQLGQGDQTRRPEPTRVPIEGVVDVDVGRNHVCAIDNRGALYCWGANNEGTLGLGDAFGSPDYYTPQRVGTQTSWEKVSCSSGHSCGLQRDGSLFCWGRNTQQQIGQDDPSQQFRGPTQVPGRYQDVVAEQSHTCAVQTDGRLACWGLNEEGRLGVGDTTPRPSPTEIAEQGPFESVSAGWFNTASIRNGALFLQGWNMFAEFFDDRDNRLVPTQIGSGSGWTEISVGRFHYCGRQSDGLVYCAGSNEFGQLGRVTDSENRHIPVGIDP